LENINLFDLIVIVLVTVLGLKGLFRGFTKEFFALIGIVGGVFVASRVSNDMGAFANSLVPMENDNTIMLVGFIISLIGFWIVAFIIGNILAKVFTLSGLGFFDRVFGFVFGAGKIFLLFSIIAYSISQVKVINDNLEPKLKDSIVFPLLVQTGAYVIKLDASGLQKEVSSTLDEAVKSTKQTIQEISTKEIQKKIDETINGTTSGN
jgi:membrane protein required for colicin V production